MNKHYARVWLSMAIMNLKNCDSIVFSSGDKTSKTDSEPFDEEFTKK